MKIGTYVRRPRAAGYLLAAGVVLAALALQPSGPHPEGDTGILRGRHGKPGHCVAFAPDGKTLASAGSPDGRGLASGGHDRAVWLRDASTGQGRAVLRGDTGEVASVAFSVDGGRVASGSCDGAVRLWQVAAPVVP
jgi:WD40 repeat protein